MFESLSEKFSSVISNLRKQGKITSAVLEDSLSQLRTSLLDSDVALPVVDIFIKNISQTVEMQLDQINKSINPAQGVFQIMQQQLVQLLSSERVDVDGKPRHPITFSKKPPTVIMLVGLQGAGKTTLAGKLALKLKSEGNTPLLVASDLQRPNAVDQLKVLGDSISIPVFAPEPGNGVGDPVKVAKAGIDFAKTKLHNIVIVDTAGRLGVDQELLQQAARIKGAVAPDEVFFVVDAMIGQDAVITAKAFNDEIGFDGVILTKLDGDARGGAALSIVQTVHKPILFASTGEKLTDFDYFYPDRIANRILGLGDLASLAETAKSVIDQDKAKQIENKIISGSGFTLNDFLEQLEAISKMGNFSQILSALPGAGAMKKQIENLDGSELTRNKAIIQSMTPAERNDPSILNGSRRARIAAGSGRQVSEINKLVDRFTMMQKMMKQMAPAGKSKGFRNPLAGLTGGFPTPTPGALLNGLPNGQPTGLPKGPAIIPPKKKSRSGNPAKRAAENLD